MRGQHSRSGCSSARLPCRGGHGRPPLCPSDEDVARKARRAEAHRAQPHRTTTPTAGLGFRGRWTTGTGANPRPPSRTRTRAPPPARAAKSSGLALGRRRESRVRRQEPRIARAAGKTAWARSGRDCLGREPGEIRNYDVECLGDVLRSWRGSRGALRLRLPGRARRLGGLAVDVVAAWYPEQHRLAAVASVPPGLATGRGSRRVPAASQLVNATRMCDAGEASPRTRAVAQGRLRCSSSGARRMYRGSC